MKNNRGFILKAFELTAAAASWITLGVLLANQIFGSGANTIQVCGAIG